MKNYKNKKFYKLDIILFEKYISGKNKSNNEK